MKYDGIIFLIIIRIIPYLPILKITIINNNNNSNYNRIEKNKEQQTKLKIPHLGFWFSKDSLSKHNTKDFLGAYI